MRPHQDGAARPGMFLGGLLVLLGVLFLLRNFGLFEVEEIWQYWPVILIALGIARISHCQGEHGKILGGLFVVIGAAILADNLGLLRWFHIQRFWPLLLVLLGLFFLIRTVEGRPQPARQADPLGTLTDWAVFGGVERRIESQDFKGGEVLAVFGGVHLDLSRADFSGSEITVDASSVFGGVELRIPPEWAVSLQGGGVFGGFADKTIHPKFEGPRPPKVFILKGFAIFGGVTVKN
jgi:hypothetical protein